MSVQSYSVFKPSTWWTSTPPQPDEADLFAKDLTSNIQRFDHKLTVAFKAADSALQNQSIFVSYLYQSSLKDLNVRYYFTNQTNDWPKEESNFKKLLLSKPISKEVNYAELDEETHLKIAEFIQQTKALFPENFAGIRYEDSPGHSNLTKVVFVAQTQFDYIANAPSNKYHPSEIANKIRSFNELTKLLETQLDLIIRKQQNKLNIPIPSPARANDLCPKEFKRISRSINKSPIQRANPTVAQPEHDPLPFATNLETNLKATQLLAKQPLFNVIFGETKSEYPQQFSFDMRDGDLQFDVTYQLNAPEFVGVFPSVISTNFNVTKEYQESQRQYCLLNSSIIQPQGTLSIKQNDLAFCMQYIVQAGWSTGETSENMQETINSFYANRNALQVL